jgi:hypothetical protein
LEERGLATSTRTFFRFWIVYYMSSVLELYFELRLKTTSLNWRYRYYSHLIDFDNLSGHYIYDIGGIFFPFEFQKFIKIVYVSNLRRDCHSFSIRCANLSIINESFFSRFECPWIYKITANHDSCSSFTSLFFKLNYLPMQWITTTFFSFSKFNIENFTF